MHGWWLELEGAAALPVRSSVDSVKCTSYVVKGKRALVVLANFGTTPATVHLSFDWAALGLRQSAAKLSRPALRVPPQKGAASLPTGAAVLVPAATKGAVNSTEGVILLLE